MVVSKISPTQQKVIDELSGERLVRLEGGFWVPESRVPEGMDYRRESLQTALQNWWVDIRTIRALERMGYLERCNDFPEEWRDSRRLVK